MIPPLQIILAALFGGLVGTGAWHVLHGSVPDWRMFGAIAGGSTMFTLTGAALLVLLQHILASHKVSRLKIGLLIVFAGSLLGGLMLGLSSGTLYLGDVGYSAYLLGGLYGALTALPLLIVKPWSGANPAAAR